MGPYISTRDHNHHLDVSLSHILQSEQRSGINDSYSSLFSMSRAASANAMIVRSSLLFPTRHVTTSIGRRGMDLVARRRLCSRPLSLLPNRRRGAVLLPKQCSPHIHLTSTVRTTRRYYQSKAGTEPGLDPNDNANNGAGNFLPQDAHTVYQVCIKW